MWRAHAATQAAAVAAYSSRHPMTADGRPQRSDFDEDGSHQIAFQTLKVSCGEETLFANNAAGGSELLRPVSKSTHKDTVEKMVME